MDASGNVLKPICQVSGVKQLSESGKGSEAGQRWNVSKW